MSRLSQAKALVVSSLGGKPSDEVWDFMDKVWREWERQVSFQVLALLADGPQTTTELANYLAESRRMLKKHLDAMEAAGLVAGETDHDQQGWPKVWTLTAAGKAAAEDEGVEVSLDYRKPQEKKQLALLDVPSGRSTKGQQGGVGPGSSRRR